MNTGASSPELIDTVIAVRPEKDLFAQALEESLIAMPYNSATEYHKSFGTGESDPRLGAACVYQTLEVADRAVELGAPKPVFLRDERHVAAVFDVENEVVVLDPYLLHRHPIRFPKEEIRAGLSMVEVTAAPTRSDRYGAHRRARLVARYKATLHGYVIRLDYSKYSPTARRYLLSRHFSLRSTGIFDPTYFTDDMRGMLTHPEQTSVSIRAVLPGLERTAEAILPLHGFAGRTFAANDIWLRTSDGINSLNEPSVSARVWRELEDSLGLDRAEISEHLVEAARIYQRVADPARPLPPYSLENE